MMDESSEDETAHLKELDNFYGKGKMQPNKNESYPIFKSKYITEQTTEKLNKVIRKQSNFLGYEQDIKYENDYEIDKSSSSSSIYY